MKLIDHLIIESANTLWADINEILLAYHIVGGDWSRVTNSSEVKAQVKARKEQVEPDTYKVQDERAKIMAQEALKWMNANGYRGKIVRVEWTARRRDIRPVDVLIEFASGKEFGISAKSSAYKGDVKFTGPGAMGLQDSLGVNFSKIIDKTKKKLISQYPKCPQSFNQMKEYLRANPKIQDKSKEYGREVLTSCRDELYSKLSKMDQKALRDHLIEDWFNASKKFPRYIKVTGNGNENFTATVTDPMKNSIMDLLDGVIVAEKAGENGIIIKGDGQTVLRLRFKWESEPLASGLSLSGDPR